jgi:cysteine-rich repeat protein
MEPTKEYKMYKMSLVSVVFLFACSGLPFERTDGTVDASVLPSTDASPDAGAVCGDGIVTAPEDCDGQNYNGASCISLGFAGGEMACSQACEFVTSLCLPAVCGNGTAEQGENCDGQDYRGATCAALGFAGGELACSQSCAFVTSLCVDEICGDGIVEGDEECDGQDFDGQTCQDFGFWSGDLTCVAGCVLSTGWCNVAPPVCGDGILHAGEQCDDGNQTAGDGCSSTCQVEPGWLCANVPSVCYTTCGDGIAAGTEECDGYGGVPCRDDCTSFSCESPAATELTCGSSVNDVIVTSSTTVSNFSTYNCAITSLFFGSAAPGPEKIFKFVATQDQEVVVWMAECQEDFNRALLDLIVLEANATNTDCNPGVCVGGDQTVQAVTLLYARITFNAVAGRTYYIILDSTVPYDPLYPEEAGFNILINCN